MLTAAGTVRCSDEGDVELPVAMEGTSSSFSNARRRSCGVGGVLRRERANGNFGTAAAGDLNSDDDAALSHVGG
ncbi:MAG: hypothetical protein ACO4BZ_07195 [Ilumatobacteraceae bacterium]